MFILLKHTDQYKGILVIAHVEYPFFQKYFRKLSKFYFIYGHSCKGFPEHLSFNYATYFIEDIYNNNYNIDDINNIVINNI